MKYDERLLVLAKIEDELANMSKVLQQMESSSLVSTPGYERFLVKYNERLTYYKKVWARHEHLCKLESSTKA